MSLSTSSILTGSYVSDGLPRIISVPGCTHFTTFDVTNINANAASVLWWANWNVGMSPDSAILGTSNVGPTDVLETFTATNGFLLVDTSSGALGPLQGPAGAVSQAPAAVVALAGHTFKNGDVVRITNTTGMFQIAGMDFTVDNVVAGVSFQLRDMDTSGFAAPATAVSARLVPFEPYFYPRRRFATKISQAAQARITMSVTHGLTVGQEVRLNIPASFGMTQMNGLVGIITAVGLADSAGSTNTIDVNIDSTAFSAFAFPASFVNYFGQFAEVVPMADNTPTLAGATINTAVIGMRLGSSVVGAAGHIINWRAERGLVV
jgi:hypothetical protein